MMLSPSVNGRVSFLHASSDLEVWALLCVSGMVANCPFERFDRFSFPLGRLSDRRVKGTVGKRK